MEMNSLYRDGGSTTRFILCHRKVINVIIEFFAVFMLCLFVYGAMVSRVGYTCDETLDFSGGGMYTYLSNGRWGLALWRIIFGVGIGARTAGILVCVFVTAAILCNMGLFRLTSSFGKLIFAMLYVALPQVAYAMKYSIQSDAVSFGVFATSLSAMLITKKDWKYTLLASLLVTFSTAIYQSLVLNYVVTIVFLVVIMMEKREKGWLQILTKGAIVTIVSLIGWFFINRLVLEYASVPIAVKQCIVEGQLSMVNHGGISNFHSLILYLLHYGLITMKTALFPSSYPGEALYASAIVPILFLCCRICLLLNMNVWERLFVNVLLIFLWCSPFVMIVFVGNEWPCQPHTRLSESLTFAGLWSMALRHVPCKKIYNYVLLIVCCVAVIRSSFHVTHYAAGERARFERTLYTFLRMEQEASEMAVEAGIPLSKGTILYFRKKSNSRKLSFDCVDFRGDYPALRYLRYGYQPEEQKTHLEALRDMPNWPAKGSVRVHEGKVIVCGETL